MTDALVPVPLSTPLIERGSGSVVWDTEGRQYVDLSAGPGVLSVGHCHPHVVDAIRAQAGTLMQSPGHSYTPLMLSLAGRLAALTGGLLPTVFFTNSGADAVDSAVKFAYRHAQRAGNGGVCLLALEGGFHGRTALPLALTGVSNRKRGFGPYGTWPGLVHLPAPNCYRCPFGMAYPSCGLRCAEALGYAIKTAVPSEPVALIAEAVQGVGGVIVPPPEYWPLVEQTCREHGIILILDEVFTGFGRTGRAFAHQHWSVRPDMITFAKAVGGGIPLGGVLATAEIAETVTAGDHYTTFGGNNQVGLAAAHAVLDVLAGEDLLARAARLGELMRQGLDALADRHSSVGDVRGIGLFLGVELVADRHTKVPAPRLAKQAQAQLLADGFLVSLAGVSNNVIRLTPPLVITDEQIEAAVDAIDIALRAAEEDACHEP